MPGCNFSQICVSKLLVHVIKLIGAFSYKTYRFFKDDFKVGFFYEKFFKEIELKLKIFNCGGIEMKNFNLKFQSGEIFEDFLNKNSQVFRWFFNIIDFSSYFLRSQSILSLRNRISTKFLKQKDNSNIWTATWKSKNEIPSSSFLEIFFSY